LNQRFKKLAEDYGFRIRDSYAFINDVWCRRPDIQSVTYRGHHLMTIPAKIDANITQRRTLEGTKQPNYFECEYKLRNWNFIIKRKPHIQGLDKKKMDLLVAETNAQSSGGNH